MIRFWEVHGVYGDTNRCGLVMIGLIDAFISAKVMLMIVLIGRTGCAIVMLLLMIAMASKTSYRTAVFVKRLGERRHISDINVVKTHARQSARIRESGGGKTRSHAGISQAWQMSFVNITGDVRSLGYFEIYF